jgi:hypothetical protein
MKINRFVAMAAIALLVVGAMGAIAGQSYAMESHNTASVKAHTSVIQAQAPVIQAQAAVIQAQALVIQAQAPVIQTQTCAQDQTDGTEMNSAGADTDNVDLQCGDQNAADGQSATGLDPASNSTQDTVGAAADTGSNIDQQVGDQSGDQNSPDTGAQAPDSGN